MRSDATRETYIKIQSKSSLAGSNGVSVSVLAADGTMVTYTPALPLVSGTPITITGSEMAAAVAAAGKTVNAGGFAANVLVNTPHADLFAYANVMDAAGAKRIPMQIVNGAYAE